MICLYIRMLGPVFGVQNFEFQHFWGVSEKCIFLEYEDFVDILLGLYLGVVPMHLRAFS